MSIFGGFEINADPKTPSQLRAALAAARFQDSELQDAVAELSDEIDTISGQAGPVSATFTSTAALGQPVYSSAAGTVNLADADATATAGVVGLVSTAASASTTGEYQPAGVLTVADWTTATGGASLTAGAVYYLSGTVGRITTTAPTSGVVVPVGRAISSTSMLIGVRPGVLL